MENYLDTFTCDNDYLRKYCKKLCGRCEGQCEDKYPMKKCQDMKGKGLCVDDNWWMKKNYIKTCALCSLI